MESLARGWKQGGHPGSCQSAEDSEDGLKNSKTKQADDSQKIPSKWKSSQPMIFCPLRLGRVPQSKLWTLTLSTRWTLPQNTDVIGRAPPLLAENPRVQVIVVGQRQQPPPYTESEVDPR
ncbi:hypothetical protein FZEAL_2655 [Fusarium zealandicum]|uniref:Uncharacterized protein n=1 Tax=Fusarium zealandicum TaxID=1053134 RepID=A0A8H4UQF1_9HYPO|nr:hypothetical protein FZEAL_2655 [Fusarium zealandicum]